MRSVLLLYGPGYGCWRIEVEPAAPAKTDLFLNVLQPSLDRPGVTGR